MSKHFFSAAIAFNWACFGSNGHAETPKELTIEAFNYRSDETFDVNNHTKFTVRPELVKDVVNPHYFEIDEPIRRPNGKSVIWKLKSLTEDIDFSDWRVNHYFIRSYAQWEAKLARGYRDNTTRDKGLFHIYDRNEVLDQSASARTDAVRALLEQAAYRLQHKGSTSTNWFSRVSSLIRHHPINDAVTNRSSGDAENLFE